MPRKTSQMNKNNRVLIKGCFFPNNCISDLKVTSQLQRDKEISKY